VVSAGQQTSNYFAAGIVGIGDESPRSDAYPQWASNHAVIRSAITSRREDLIARSSPSRNEAPKFRTDAPYSCSAVQ
jgi:hypothetical protein